MSVEVVEELAPVGGSRPSVGNSHTARGQLHESITVGSRTSGFSEPVRETTGNAPVEQETMTIGKRLGRSLPAGAQKMLDNIDKHGTVSDDPPAVVANDAPPAAAAPAPAAPATPTGAPQVAPTAAATAAPDKSTEDAIAEHRSRADRLAEHNQKLVTELEQLRSRPARGEPTAREKALDEAERTIIDDSVGAVRKVIATALGVDDPKHPDVDKHLTWLYHDLTERELGVPLDPSIKAQRESERVKHLLARDKRDRTQEAQKPAEPAVDQELAQKSAVVARMIGEGDHVTKYPLLRSLSEDFDGMKPEVLLWKEISRGLKTGEYANPTTREQDNALIDQASRRIESHYQVLAEKISKATQKAPTSTATPTQATVATDQKAEPQGTGPRTITNASASVAPATPPAAQPAPTQTPAKPWRNEKERVRMLIAKHSGEPIR